MKEQFIKPVIFLKDIELVYAIIDVFEDLLYDNNMYIPDEERTGAEDEACIFGQTFDKIHDKLFSIIERVCH